jgi:hypothetical protein
VLICNGGSISLDINSSTTPSSGSVEYDYSTSASSASITGFTASATSQPLNADIAVATLNNTSTTRQTLTYTITPRIIGSGAGACAGTPIQVVVSIDPTPSVSSASSRDICSGAAVNYVPSGNVSGTVFNWTASVSSGTVTGFTASGSGTITDVLTNNTNSIGVVRYVITPVANGCTGSAFNFDVTVEPGALITATPSSVLICNGGSISLDINSSTTPSSGSVEYDYSTSASSASVTGFTASATSQPLNADIAVATLNNTSTTRQTLTYTITPRIIGSGAGACAGTPIQVVVSIDPTPSLTNLPNSVNICSGETLNFVPLSDVGGTTFSWTTSGGANITGETLSGTGSITDVLTNTGSTIQLMTYTITATGPGPLTCANSTPQTYTVTVSPSVTQSIINNAAEICEGTSTDIDYSTPTQNGVVSVKALYAAGVTGNINYSVLTVVGSNGKINETLSNTTLTPKIVTYTFTATGNNCTPITETVFVTVKPIPSLSVTNNASVICSSSQTNIDLSDATQGAVITLISVVASNPSVYGYSAVNSTWASGSKVIDVLHNPTNVQQSVTYTFSSSAAGCIDGANEIVVVMIRPEAVFTITNNSPVICEGPLSPTNILLSSSVNGSEIKLVSATASNAGLTGYTAAGTLYSSFPGSIVISDVLNNNTNASQTITYEFEVSIGGLCVNPLRKTVTVTINPAPAGVNDSKAVCSDLAVNYSLLNNLASVGNNVGSTFTWVASSNPDVTGENTSPQSGSEITDVINNIQNGDRNVLYTVTPKSTSGCVGSTFQINVTVKPEPLGITSADVICSNLPVTHNLQTNITNIPSNFSWVATAHPNITGESTSLQSGSTVTDVLINPTNSQQTVTYTITPVAQGSGCFGNNFTISVPVNARAKISAGPDLSLCENIPSIQLQGSVNFAPNGIIWSGGQGVFASTNIANATYSFKNPDEINTSFTLQLQANDPDGSGPCPIEVDNMSLRINRLPVVVFTGLPVGAPPKMAENLAAITLTGNQIGGSFTILPITSNIGSTVIDPVAKVSFDPDAVELGSNHITYTYTDGNGCTNFDTQEVFINAVTAASFSIENAVKNADGLYELCAEQGLVKLQGTPPASQGKTPGTEFIMVDVNTGDPISGPGPIVKQGNDFYIQTTGTTSGVYRIEYIYVNNQDAVSRWTESFKLFAAPVAKFTSSNNCIASDVEFLDDSKVNPTPFDSEIITWQWDFDDGEIRSEQNPKKKYFEADTYLVTLKVTTNQGCTNETDPNANPIRVGAVPNPQFIWSSICNSDSTKFLDKSNALNSIIEEYTWDFGDGDIITGKADASIGDNVHNGRTSGFLHSPNHKFLQFGTYNTKITVKTNDGCVNTLTKKVFILPYSTVKPVSSDAYFESFEANEGGWIPEAFEKNSIASDTSWIWGIPTGAHLTSGGNNSQRAWWTGNNQGSYYPFENSVVNGPCFDLTELKRPMISLDYFSDADVSDGAVLQFSTDGGLNWNVIGPSDASQLRIEGINWYNALGIFSNPGSQSLGQYGWTGTANEGQAEWRNARFNMDMVPHANRKQVRLRVAFSSDDGNPDAKPYDGFAFDNVFVGDKRRKVMVEHFTNASNSQAANQYLNNLYDTQIPLKQESDFFKIQYHMPVPGVDELNQQNPSDPAARAFMYDVTLPPIAIMDGITGNFYGKDLSGDHAQLNKIVLDQRALEDPLFDISITPLASSSSVLKARVTFTYIDTVQLITNPVVFHAALIETDIDGNKNVVRKLLLQPEGLTVNRGWQRGDVQTIDIDYTIDVQIADPDKLYMAAFVQDKTGFKVHQSAIVKAPAKNGILPVSTNDPVAHAEIRDINIYPNPASGQLNLSLQNILTKDYQWEIIDQHGITLLKGDLNRDLREPQHIIIKDLSNGVYFVKIALSDNAIVYRKVVVLNSH